MPTQEEHLLQFEHNRQVAQQLSDSAEYDWAIVALFYATLHLIQAHLVRVGVAPRTHAERNRRLLSSVELRPAYDPYRALRDHSEEAL